MGYLLSAKAVRALTPLVRGKMTSTGVDYSASPVDADKYPLPFALRWSAEESNWVIWLPDIAKLVYMGGQAYTITGVTAAQHLPQGYYTIDSITTGGSPASTQTVYLEIRILSQSSGQGTTPTTTITVNIVDTPVPPATGEQVYSLLLANIAHNVTTDTFTVKQFFTSTVFIGGVSVMGTDGSVVANCATVKFVSAIDSNVVVTVAPDPNTGGTATATVGVYYL